MDNSVLRKRLQTYKTSEGRLRNVGDDVIIEVLRAWEQWPGTSADLYRDLDLTKMQLVTIIKKAKNLVKSGYVTESEFREMPTSFPEAAGSNICAAVELTWKDGNIIRFSQVEYLIDFLNKVA